MFAEDGKSSGVRGLGATVVIAALAAVTSVVGTVAPAGAAPAQGHPPSSAKLPTLDGEQFTAASAVLNPSTGCGLQQNGDVSFSASGTATGPYPGTFTETGNWSFDLMVEQTFQANFTIVSGSRVVTGVILYDQTSTGPDGRSLAQNLGGCGWSNAGGAYSTCANQQLTGKCAGQAVAFIYPSSFSQTFEKPVAPYSLVIVSGDNQTSGLSTTGFLEQFPAPIVTQLLDRNGAPVGGMAVSYTTQTIPGGGYPQGPWVTTDWDGMASMPVFAGTAPGTFTVTAKGPKRTSAVFTLTEG